MEIKNNSIATLLKNRKLRKEEVTILFESKQDYNDIKTKLFNSILKKVIRFQPSENRLNLSYIYFPQFNFNHFTIDKQEIDFSHSVFQGTATFSEAVFQGEVCFRNSIFEKKAYFWGVQFRKYIMP